VLTLSAAESHYYNEAAIQRGADATAAAVKKGKGRLMPEGVTSASLIIIILVAAAVGAAAGGMLGPNFDPPVLAVISGFIATIVAVLVRNELINRLSGAGPSDFKIPLVVAVFAVVASLAGSLGGKEILDDVGGTHSPVWVGTIAGLASAILMSMLMITCYMEARRG